MTMPDGNSSTLRIRDAAEARAEERHEAYGEQAIESVIYDLFDGRKVAGRAIHDFMDDLALSEIAAILLARTRDDQRAAVASIEARVRGQIRDWCEQDRIGNIEIAERVGELAREAA